MIKMCVAQFVGGVNIAIACLNKTKLRKKNYETNVHYNVR